MYEHHTAYNAIDGHINKETPVNHVEISFSLGFDKNLKFQVVKYLKIWLSNFQGWKKLKKFKEKRLKNSILLFFLKRYADYSVNCGHIFFLLLKSQQSESDSE